MVEAKNTAASNIAAETVQEVDIPCLSRTTTGLIKMGIDGLERITQDCLRRKGVSNLHRDFFVLMGVCLLLNCFVMKLCDIKLV